MAQYTQEELLEMARKMLAQKEKEKVRSKAYTIAVRNLISKNQAEFDRFYADAKTELGI